MTRQGLPRRMMQTDDLARRRFELVAAEFLVRMGERMQTRRAELGLSRGEVARRVPGKVSENQIYRWELGKHQPNPDTLEALAKALQTTVAYFMTPVPVETKTPDLTVTLNGETQLDRIERLLTQLAAAALLEEAVSEAEAAAPPVEELRPKRHPRRQRPA